MNVKGRIAVLAALAAGIVAVMAAKHWSGPADPPAGARPLRKDLPTLIDIGGGKCTACTMMVPVMESLARDFAGRLNVRMLDVLEDPETDKYKVGLIPLQVFEAPGGKELFRHEGFMSREDILAKWKALGYDLDAPPGGRGG